MSESTPPPLPPPLPAWGGFSPSYPPPRRGKKVLIAILVISLVANIILFMAMAVKKASSLKTTSSHYKETFLTGFDNPQNKIVVIRLEGIITSHSDGPHNPDGMVGSISDQIQIALDDTNVKAIILRIDSPGGEVLASDRLYRLLREAREKKPIICLMGSVAASGGFYAAMGTSHIMADELTITGSIGVIMQTLNYQGLFDKVGLKTLVFKSGKYKDLLNGDREATPEEMELVQTLVMESYDKFYQIVLNERNRNGELISPDTLRNSLADGRIFSGRQAFQSKLIDQLGTFEDSIAKAQEMAGIKDAQVMEYQQPFSFGDFFRIFGEAKSQTIKIDVGLSSELKMETGKLYFLSYHLF